MTPAEQIREQIAQLQQQLLTAHPMMPTLLQTIHKQLADNPEVVTILSEEEVGAIVNGLKQHTKTVIATSIAKTKTKSAKSIGLADL